MLAPIYMQAPHISIALSSVGFRCSFVRHKLLGIQHTALVDRISEPHWTSIISYPGNNYGKTLGQGRLRARSRPKTADLTLLIHRWMTLNIQLPLPRPHLLLRHRQNFFFCDKCVGTFADTSYSSSNYSHSILLTFHSGTSEIPNCRIPSSIFTGSWASSWRPGRASGAALGAAPTGRGRELLQH